MHASHTYSYRQHQTKTISRYIVSNQIQWGHFRNNDFNMVVIIPVETKSLLIMDKHSQMKYILKIKGLIPVNGQKVRSDALVIERKYICIIYLLTRLHITVLL